jgi:hypothetical protein
MEPIISPWFFYLIGVVPSLVAVFNAVGIPVLVVSRATPDNIESIIGIGTALKDEVKSDVLDVINTIKE